MLAGNENRVFQLLHYSYGQSLPLPATLWDGQTDRAVADGSTQSVQPEYSDSVGQMASIIAGTRLKFPQDGRRVEANSGRGMAFFQLLDRRP